MYGYCGINYFKERLLKQNSALDRSRTRPGPKTALESELQTTLRYSRLVCARWKSANTTDKTFPSTVAVVGWVGKFTREAKWIWVILHMAIWFKLRQIFSILIYGRHMFRISLEDDHNSCGSIKFLNKIIVQRDVRRLPVLTI